MLTGVAAIVFAFYTNSISPSSHGNFFELYGIAAAVLGGCSLRGGEGSVLGILLGTTLLQVLQNLVNLLGIPSSLNFAVMGGVILIGVVGDQVLQRRGARVVGTAAIRCGLHAPTVGPNEENRMSLQRTAALGCLVLLALGGCGREQSSTKRLAFITNNAADFWTIARKGTEKADAGLAGVEVEFRLGDGTAAEQKRILDDLLAKGVDGIAISPVDPANQTGMLNDAAHAGAGVHARQRRARQQAGVLRRDRQRRGRHGRPATLIKEALPQGGKIAVFVGKLDARNAQERLQGIKESIAGSAVEIIDVRTDDTDRFARKRTCRRCS